MNGSGIAALKGQGKPGQKVSGKSILLVLKTYAEHANNTSGECWPSQPTLAEQSGTSPKTVQRVQEWAIAHGWLEVVAPPIPGVRGTHVRLTIGRIPTEVVVKNATRSWSTGGEVMVNSHEVVVSSDQQTLTTTLNRNSHEPTTSPSDEVASNSQPLTLGEEEEKWDSPYVSPSDCPCTRYHGPYVPILRKVGNQVTYRCTWGDDPYGWNTTMHYLVTIQVRPNVGGKSYWRDDSVPVRWHPVPTTS